MYYFPFILCNLGYLAHACFLSSPFSFVQQKIFEDDSLMWSINSLCLFCSSHFDILVNITVDITVNFFLFIILKRFFQLKKLKTINKSETNIVFMTTRFFSCQILQFWGITCSIPHADLFKRFTHIFQSFSRTLLWEMAEDFDIVIATVSPPLPLERLLDRLVFMTITLVQK